MCGAANRDLEAQHIQKRSAISRLSRCAEQLLPTALPAARWGGPTDAHAPPAPAALHCRQHAYSCARDPAGLVPAALVDPSVAACPPPERCPHHTLPVRHLAAPCGLGGSALVPVHPACKTAASQQRGSTCALVLGCRAQSICCRARRCPCMIAAGGASTGLSGRQLFPTSGGAVIRPVGPRRRRLCCPMPQSARRAVGGASSDATTPTRRRCAAAAPAASYAAHGARPPSNAGLVGLSGSLSGRPRAPRCWAHFDFSRLLKLAPSLRPELTPTHRNAPCRCTTSAW